MAEKPPKGAFDTYMKMVKEISEPMKLVREISPISSAAKELYATSLSVNELVTSIQVTGSIVNPARFFDSASAIQTLAVEALSKPGKASRALEKIEKESAKAKEKIKKLLDPKSASARMMDYYSALADAEVISSSLVQIGNAIKKAPKLRTKIKERIGFSKLVDKISGWIQGIINLLKRIGISLKGVIAGFDKKLLAAALKLKETIAAGIKITISKFRDLVKKFHNFMMYLIKKTFDFAAEVQKVAEEKKFPMKEIMMELPSYDLEIVNISGFPILIPKIRAPKLTITFGPRSIKPE